MENLVRTICQKEGIDARTIQSLSGGQVNQVFRIGDQYVVRIGQREDAFQRLERETDLLRGLENQIPVPKIVGFGQHDGFVYQIQEFIHGQKLYLVWKDLAAGQQEAIAAELAGYLKIIHRQSSTHFGSVRHETRLYDSWPDYLSDRFTRTIEEIKSLNIRVVPGFLEMAIAYFEENKAFLNEGQPALVHGDLSMVNILVDHGQITGLLDFEYALHAPIDYELCVMEAFCLYPNDWAEEDHEVCCAADFASFIPLVRQHYPGLFEAPHLRERVNIYHLSSTLGSYLGWRKDNLAKIPPEKMAAKEFYMARITNFIFRHGIRLF